ncbi:peptide ABC transporter substrate-binding protein [Mechercharimyces sp. CAU 1602]|uniref:peptide ABC transporter substrate-binding protein n=1 Tax=Mechercharimyces sp. CAU 1602 TaxID=2973933 RepID=UPI0021619F36|nr:peptide ABC transporter substrate-binding protein [Mechercharimyces sp. CAU 1602]MCS1351418.1 peptide ABC transporter substrate-binding protein [Mechercharimyces sp. CAU 1602]
MLFSRKFLTLMLVFALAFTTTACGLFGEEEGKKGEGDDSPDHVVINVPAAISDLDLSTARDTLSISILNNAFEGLLRLDEDNKPTLGMAESYNVDKLTYTFKLRDSKWSDGKEVTAHDFEYAWKRALNPKIGSHTAFVFFPIKNARDYHTDKATADDVGIKALDDKTFQVELERPVSDFLSRITLPTFSPLRQDIIEEHGKEYGQSAETMIYNGPFTLTDVSENQVVKLRKNEQYWDKDNVQLDSVDIQVVKDTALGINQFNSGEVDVTRLNSDFVEAYEDSDEFDSTQIAATEFLQVNHSSKPFFQNANIRKAISYAIDRQQLVAAMSNGSQAAYGLVPPTVTMYNGKSYRSFANEKLIPEDSSQKAREYLEKGMNELNMRADDIPTRIEMLCYDDERKEMCVGIKGMLKKNLGLEVQLNALPREQKIEKEARGEFDLTLSGWFAFYNNPMTFLDIWTSNSTMNFGHYKSDEFNSLIGQAYQSTDEKQVELIKKAETKLIKEDSAVIPLYYVGESYVVRRNVMKIIRHPFGSAYSLKWGYIAKEIK